MGGPVLIFHVAKYLPSFSQLAEFGLLRKVDRCRYNGFNPWIADNQCYVLRPDNPEQADTSD